MSAIITIAKNELYRLLISPFAWVVLASLQFLLATFFYLLLSKYMEAGALYAGRGLTEIVVIGLLQIAGLIMLVISPFITMRSISEELRSGTIKLLLSSPLSISELVLGKYLGVMAYYFGIVCLIALMPLSLSFGTTLDYGHLASALLGLGLLFSSFAAIGIFISSLSQSPALAAVSSFMFTFLLWIVHIASDASNAFVDTLANYLSLQKHFNSLLSGAFSSTDVFYYLLLSALFIVLCIWRLDALRTHQ